MKKCKPLLLFLTIILALCSCKNSNSTSSSLSVTSSEKIQTESRSEVSVTSEIAPSEINPTNQIPDTASSKPVVSSSQPAESQNPVIEEKKVVEEEKKVVEEEKFPGYKTYTYVPNNSNHEYHAYEQKIFDTINKKRTEAGLDPLLWNDTIYECTKERAVELTYLFSTNRSDGHRKGLTIYDDYGFNPQYVNEHVASIRVLNNTELEAERTYFTAGIGDDPYYMDIISDKYISATVSAIISTRDFGSEGHNPQIFVVLTFMG